MNKISMLLAGLLGAAVFSAQAGELYAPQQFQDPQSTLTRAQVKQETIRAEKAGEIQFGDVALPKNGQQGGSAAPEFARSRASVKSEVLAAQKAGELQFGDVGQIDASNGSQLTRAQVKAEAVAARQLTKTAPGRNTIDY